MSIIEILEEIVMTHELCANQFCVESSCPHYEVCCSVFGKKNPTEELEELAAQCKVFNEFARANRKE